LFILHSKYSVRNIEFTYIAKWLLLNLVLQHSSIIIINILQLTLAGVIRYKQICFFNCIFFCEIIHIYYWNIRSKWDSVTFTRFEYIEHSIRLCKCKLPTFLRCHEAVTMVLTQIRDGGISVVCGAFALHVSFPPFRRVDEYGVVVQAR
jgi:hypothetical protein